MRLKIIAGNLIIVAVVGLGAFFMVRSQVTEGLAQRLESRLPHEQQLFAQSWDLSVYRLLQQTSAQASSADARSVFAASGDSRRRRAYELAQDTSGWFQDPARGRGGPPDLVVVTDNSGVVVARDNDINRMYGQPLGDDLPDVIDVLRSKEPRFAIWRREGKLLQTGIAPIAGEGGAVLGALVVGYDISSGYASSEARLLGHDIAFVSGESVYSASLDAARSADLQQALFGDLARTTKAALGGQVSSSWYASVGGDTYVGIVAPLPRPAASGVAYAVLADRDAATSLASAANAILWLTGLGIIAIIVFGFLLANHFLRPLETIEEGVLAVINGDTNLRLDVESAELGGLAYRINQLINVFTGVEEQDAEGRTAGTSEWAPVGDVESEAPATAAAAVGASPSAAATQGDDAPIDEPEAAAALAAEPEQSYYARLYREYVAAKKALGEDVSNVPEARFVQRIKGNEANLAQKHGCRMVRFQVQTRANQVILRPVLIR
ncbi:MAG: hypothetical protein KC543_13370 [Myxococcales bacterium]|nr:hypothetical protein [Myxococcales bacterium]